MIWSVDGLVKGFYIGSAMIAVQFLPGGGVLSPPWLKRSGDLLYLGLSDGLMARVA